MKCRDIYGAESDQMTYANNSLESLFEGLLGIADKNKDKKISIDEWVSCLKATSKKEPKWFQDYLTYMFKLFDVSADKIVDIAEYTDGMSAYGFGSYDAHQAFKAFAKDKAGKPIKGLDWFQWKDRFNEYFFSKDKKALGNHLFGVFS